MSRQARDKKTEEKLIIRTTVGWFCFFLRRYFKCNNVSGELGTSLDLEHSFGETWFVETATEEVCEISALSDLFKFWAMDLPSIGIWIGIELVLLGTLRNEKRVQPFSLLLRSCETFATTICQDRLGTNAKEKHRVCSSPPLLFILLFSLLCFSCLFSARRYLCGAVFLLDCDRVWLPPGATQRPTP